MEKKYHNPTRKLDVKKRKDYPLMIQKSLNDYKEVI